MRNSESKKDLAEIENLHAETAWNRFNIFNTVVLLFIAVLTFVTNQTVENLKQDVETAKFMESTIDNLTVNENNREIALSIVYSMFVKEKLEQFNSKPDKVPHKTMLVDVAETVLQVNEAQSAANPQTLSTSKAMLIICDLDQEKCKNWRDRARLPEESKQSNENKKEFASAILKSSQPSQDQKGLVFLQYNDPAKKDLIEEFRIKQLLPEWKAPGMQLVESYKAPTNKMGEVRYFHNNDNEQKLAKQLQETLNQKYCPQQSEGCFITNNLSSKYPNVPDRQFEIWIDNQQR